VTREVALDGEGDFYGALENGKKMSVKASQVREVDVIPCIPTHVVLVKNRYGAPAQLVLGKSSNSEHDSAIRLVDPSVTHSPTGNAHSMMLPGVPVQSPVFHEEMVHLQVAQPLVTKRQRDRRAISFMDIGLITSRATKKKKKKMKEAYRSFLSSGFPPFDTTPSACNPRSFFLTSNSTSSPASRYLNPSILIWL